MTLEIIAKKVPHSVLKAAARLRRFVAMRKKVTEVVPGTPSCSLYN